MERYVAAHGRLAFMLQAIVNGCIFDGESVHEHKAVLIEGEHIVAVVDH